MSRPGMTTISTADFSQIEARVLASGSSTTGRTQGQGVPGFKVPNSRSVLLQTPPRGLQKVPEAHGVGGTVDEAVNARTEGWRLPFNAVHHKDGAVALRLYCTLHEQSYLLTVACWVWPLTFDKGKTVMQAGAERRRQSLLTWRVPASMPKPAMADMLLGVVDILAANNGCEMALVGCSHKVLNRLRHGHPRTGGRR